MANINHVIKNNELLFHLVPSKETGFRTGTLVKEKEREKKQNLNILICADYSLATLFCASNYTSSICN